MKRKNKSIFKVILFGLLCVIVLAAFAFDVRLVTRTYTVKSNKITKPIKIGFVADFHSCDYGDRQRTLMEAIDRSRPELILLGGDIIDDHLPQKNAIELMSQLRQKYPVYYVSGNHEYWTNDIDTIKNTISELNIPVLDGESKILDIDGQQIMLAGIDDPEVGESLWQQQLKFVAKSREESIFSLLLSHRPERFEDYLPYKFDLVLSGHAHGGQWRIPLILNGVCAPNQGFFPKYAGGLYQKQATTMIVSRGLARETTRLPRIFNRPEYVVVDIVPN